MDLLLVGYGTLLYEESRSHTMGQATSDGTDAFPVIVRDYRRLFNLRPPHYPTSHRLFSEPIENAALNVEPALGVRVNALAFRVTLDQLDALDRRERYYRRHLIPLYTFTEESFVGEGYLYASDPDAPWISRDTSKLMPLWRDIVWARTGAYRVGLSFGRFFDETTYLADGRSLMIDRYRGHLDDAGTDVSR